MKKYFLLVLFALICMPNMVSAQYGGLLIDQTGMTEWNPITTSTCRRTFPNGNVFEGTCFSKQGQVVSYNGTMIFPDRSSLIGNYDVYFRADGLMYAVNGRELYRCEYRRGVLVSKQQIETNGRSFVISGGAIIWGDYVPNVNADSYNSGGINSGRSSGTNSGSYTTCRRCSGTGKCSSCGGTGKTTTFSGKSMTSCGSCQGSGDCPSPSCNNGHYNW